MQRRQVLRMLASAGLWSRRGDGQSLDTDQLVDIGGFRLHAKTWGAGDPCFAIDVGLGESIEKWQPVIEEIKSATRVCAYERAGYGRSDAGPYPRTAARAAEEFRMLLSSLGCRSPYILAGHSLGAAYAMTLAAAHPRLVAALLLLDPPPLDFVTGKRFPALQELAVQQTAEFKRLAGEARKQNEVRKAVFFETLASEHEAMFGESAAELKRIRSFGLLPVTVIASGVSNPMFGPDAEEFQRFWIESNRQVAALSRRGKFLLAERSTHHIHRDAPELVVREALELVANTRQQARPL